MKESEKEVSFYPETEGTRIVPLFSSAVTEQIEVVLREYQKLHEIMQEDNIEQMKADFVESKDEFQMLQYVLFLKIMRESYEDMCILSQVSEMTTETVEDIARQNDTTVSKLLMTSMMGDILEHLEVASKN